MDVSFFLLLRFVSSIRDSVRCDDVRPGSIIVTLHGYMDDIDFVYVTIIKSGLDLPTFGVFFPFDTVAPSSMPTVVS